MTSSVNNYTASEAGSSLFSNGESNCRTSSQAINSIQKMFTESQLIAYVGLCYLSIQDYKNKMFIQQMQEQQDYKKFLKKALSSYDEWANMIIKKLFLYLDFPEGDQKMIESLANHGILPEDLAKPLISEAEKAKMKRKELELKKKEYLEMDIKKYNSNKNHDMKIINEEDEEQENTYIDSDNDNTENHEIKVNHEEERKEESSMENNQINQEKLNDIDEKIQIENINDNNNKIPNNDEDKVSNELVLEDNEEIHLNNFDTKNTYHIKNNSKNSQKDNQSEIGSELMKKIDEMSLEDVLEVSDIRYIILSHLFLICIGDGTYDSRSRGLLRRVANYLNVDYHNVIKIENEIIFQIKATQDVESLQRDNKSMDNRESQYKKKRWLYMGLASLSGGLVIGLTAGLAAPLISTGLGATLLHLGVHGTTAFLGSTGGIALISSAGTVTGASLTGMKMAKRTRGVSEFEFIKIEDWKKEVLEKEKNEENKNDHLVDEPKEMNVENIENSEKRNDVDNNLLMTLEENIQTDEDEKTFIETNSQLEKTPKQTNSNEIYSEETQSICDKTITNEEIFNEHKEVDENNFHIPNKTTSSSLSGISVTSNGSTKDSETDEKLKKNYINVLITVSGWSTTEDKYDFFLPWSILEPDTYGDHYCLQWESKELKELGNSINIIASELFSIGMKQLLGATILPVIAAMSLPIWLLKLNYTVDNPWGIGLSKAQKTGLVLADTLMGNYQENRPITLIGYSLGARVIYYCLKELAEKNVYGVIEDVYLIGTPVVESEKEWRRCCSVVSGKIVNGYLTNDWVLGFLYRASSGSFQSVAGLAPIEGIPSLENVCLDDIVNGHLDYRRKIPLILKRFGLRVTNDTFETEEVSNEKERLCREEGVKIEKEKEKKENETLNDPAINNNTTINTSNININTNTNTNININTNISNSNSSLQNIYDPKTMSSKESLQQHQHENSGGFKKLGNWIKSFSPSQTNIASIDHANTNYHNMTPEEREMYEIEKEEELERQRIKKQMEEFFQPREIKGTMPKLILQSKIDNTTTSSTTTTTTPSNSLANLSNVNPNKNNSLVKEDSIPFYNNDDKSEDNEELILPKEIKSTLPTLVVVDLPENKKDTIQSLNTNKVNKKEEKKEKEQKVEEELCNIRQLPSTQPILKIKISENNNKVLTNKSSSLSSLQSSSLKNEFNPHQAHIKRNTIPLSSSVDHFHSSVNRSLRENLKMKDEEETILTAPSSPSYLPLLYSQMTDNATVTDTNLLFDFSTDSENEDDENDEKDNNSENGHKLIPNEETKDTSSNQKHERSISNKSNTSSFAKISDLDLNNDHEEKKYEAFERARKKREEAIENEKQRKLEAYEKNLKLQQQKEHEQQLQE